MRDNTKNPILTISLLASDRMNTIRRCLDSLDPIREAIPVELIIIDTSSKDEIHNILLEYTDIVEKFTWCNDFSKARNIGLKKAKGEWFLFLDDDEWFVEYDDLIQFFKSGEYKKYKCATYMCRNFIDENFEYYSDSWVSRMTQIEPDTEFRSKIHEYIYPFDGPCKYIYARVNHTGYIFKTEADKRKHFERNTSLLKGMEEEEPDNLRWQVQFVQEYRAMSEWETLEEYAQTRIEKSKGRNNGREGLQVMTLYAAYLIALFNLKKYDKMLEKCDELISDKRCTNLAKAMAYLQKAEGYYALNQYREAISFSHKFLKEMRNLKKDKERMQWENGSLIVNETSDDIRPKKAYSIIICSSLKLGKMDGLKEYYKNLSWGNSVVYVYANTDLDILNELLSMGEFEWIEKVIVDGFQCVDFRTRLIQYVQSFEEKDYATFLKLAKIVSNIEFDSWYKYYVSIICHEEETNEEMELYTKKLVPRLPNIFMIPGDVLSVLNEYGINACDYYEEIEFERWKKDLLEYIEGIEWNKFENLKSRLENSAINRDVKFGYFMMIYLEQRLQKNVDVQVNLENHEKDLQLFSLYTTQTYQVLFGNELENMEIEDLPDNYLAAKWIELFFESAAKNLKEALPCLGKAVEVYPILSSAISYYLGKIKETYFG